MLEVLVALDVAQREMKNQFELDAPARANARDADRKRRSPVRAARALALRVLPKAQTIRSSQRAQTACSEGSVGDGAQAAG